MLLDLYGGGGVAFGNGLTLTPAGTADGFSLSTFATTNPGAINCCPGPFGVAVASSGNIIVNTADSGKLYVFQDADGQTTGTALFTQTTNYGTAGFATAGGVPYGSNNTGDGSGPGQYFELNSDGTINHVLTDVADVARYGMAGDPANGHIIADSFSGLVDIDPLANGGLGSLSVINPNVFGDGVSVSPDGTTAYVEQYANSTISAYNIATGDLVFSVSDSVFASAGMYGPDGTGVITSSSSLNGDLLINFNGNGSTTGGVGLLDHTTDAFTVIATGGTRGDYASPDTNNGTVFLDYSDTVERLSCGPACDIGSAPPHMSVTPEPASLVLLGSGLAGWPAGGSGGG